MAVLRAAEYREVPWKNGGGTTREIALARDPQRPESPLWRLSIATIGADGPFSDFSGYDRTIVALEGNGVELNFDDGESVRLDRPYASCSFAGERRLACRLLDGPVRDFNVMTRRDRCAHAVTIAHLAAGEPCDPGSARVALILAGRLRANGEEARRFDLVAFGHAPVPAWHAGGGGASLCLVRIHLGERPETIGAHTSPH